MSTCNGDDVDGNRCTRPAGHLHACAGNWAEYVEDHDALEEQRDELLEALKDLVSSQSFAFGEHTHVLEKSYERARALIERIEKEGK